MNAKKIVAALLLSTSLVSAVSASAAYSAMSEVFVPNAIDATTRWGSPVKLNGVESFPTVTSKEGRSPSNPLSLRSITHIS